MAASHTHPVPATFTDEEISALYEAGLHEPNAYGVWWVVCPHCHQRLYNISKEKFAREHCWAYIDKKGHCKVDPRDLELPPAARAAAVHANLQAAAPASSSSSSSRGHSSSIHGEDSMTSSKRRRIESPSQAVSDASPGRGAQHGESAGHPVQAADSNSEEHSSAAPAGEDGGALDTASEHTWDGGVSSDTDEDAAEEGAEQPGQPAAGVDVLADFEYDGDAAGDAADLQRLRAAAAELAAVLTTPEPHTLSPHSPKLLTAYRERLNQPLYDGCPKPLRYWVVHWMQLLLQGGVNRATFDQMLHAERTGHKQPNLVPPSSYMLKRIVGLKPLSAYEWHVCSCGKHAWQPLDSAQWPSAHFLSQPEQQRGEQPRRLADVPTEQHSCPQCKAPRFQQHVQPGDTGWVSYTPYAVLVPGTVDNATDATAPHAANKSPGPQMETAAAQATEPSSAEKKALDKQRRVQNILAQAREQMQERKEDKSKAASKETQKRCNEQRAAITTNILRKAQASTGASEQGKKVQKEATGCKAKRKRAPGSDEEVEVSEDQAVESPKEKPGPKTKRTRVPASEDEMDSADTTDSEVPAQGNARRRPQRTTAGKRRTFDSP